MFCQLRAGICQQAVSFELPEEEAALTRPFCPAPPPSCPGGVGSKSTLAATHTHTHTHTHVAGLHTNVSAPVLTWSALLVHVWGADWNISTVLSCWQLLLKQCVSSPLFSDSRKIIKQILPLLTMCCSCSSILQLSTSTCPLCCCCPLCSVGTGHEWCPAESSNTKNRPGHFRTEEAFWTTSEMSSRPNSDLTWL